MYSAKTALKKMCGYNGIKVIREDSVIFMVKKIGRYNHVYIRRNKEKRYILYSADVVDFLEINKYNYFEDYKRGRKRKKEEERERKGKKEEERERKGKKEKEINCQRYKDALEIACRDHVLSDIAEFGTGGPYDVEREVKDKMDECLKKVDEKERVRKKKKEKERERKGKRYNESY